MLNGERTVLFKRLYEDNVLGRIPNKHFRLRSSQYTTEQAERRNRRPKLEEHMGQLPNSLINGARQETIAHSIAMFILVLNLRKLRSSLPPLSSKRLAVCKCRGKPFQRINDTHGLNSKRSP